MTRKEREFLARRAEILEAATRLFAKKGYHGTTMNEIAREAEFSTGSLYNFFQNKEELYFTLMREKIGALEDKIQDVYQSDGGIEDKLVNFVDITLGYFEEERDFFRIFAEQRTSFQDSAKGEFADIIHEKYQNYLGNMVKLMEQGIKDGVFKPINPMELALIFLGVLNTFLFVFVNIQTDYKLRDKGKTILEIFFDGTRAR